MQRSITGLIIVMFLASNLYAAVPKYPARNVLITLENAGNEPKQLADEWKEDGDECYYIAFRQNGKIKEWKTNPDEPVLIRSGRLVKVFSMQPMILYMLPFDWMEYYPNLEYCQEAY